MIASEESICDKLLQVSVFGAALTKLSMPIFGHCWYVLPSDKYPKPLQRGGPGWDTVHFLQG